ncbi:MAG: hypothetical protein JWO80_4924 [Bryobacterales bacterium]|nr:hypothetical protein [Bryobacterales bacterium]
MTVPDKRVAILSPVAWRTPPRHYGAWETVASNVTEGLVSRGWDVTLFATRDSVTRAHLHAVVERGYEEDPAIDPKVAEYLHISYTRLVKTPVGMWRVTLSSAATGRNLRVQETLRRHSRGQWADG